MDKNDRRHFPRQRKKATIQVLIASDGPKDRWASNDFIPAKMCNQSDEGLYIEIDRVLMPGANVRIKMASPEGHHSDGAYCLCDGRAIRCEKLADATACFGVGIKILRKVIQARVLTSRFK